MLLNIRWVLKQLNISHLLQILIHNVYQHKNNKIIFRIALSIRLIAIHYFNLPFNFIDTTMCVADNKNVSTLASSRDLLRILKVLQVNWGNRIALIFTKYFSILFYKYMYGTHLEHYVKEIQICVICQHFNVTVKNRNLTQIPKN